MGVTSLEVLDKGMTPLREESLEQVSVLYAVYPLTISSRRIAANFEDSVLYWLIWQ